MTTMQAPETPAAQAAVAPPAPRRRLPVPHRADVLAALVYLAAGFWLAMHLWLHPRHRVLASFPPDQYQFEFWLSHAARIFTPCKQRVVGA